MKSAKSCWRFKKAPSLKRRPRTGLPSTLNVSPSGPLSNTQNGGSELAREEGKGTAIIQNERVVVDVLREQARSYNCFCACVIPRYTPSTTKVVWNLFLSRIQWICSNNKKLCCEDKNNERQHLPLDSKQPAFQGAGEKKGKVRLDSLGDHARALLRFHPVDCLRATSAGGQAQPRFLDYLGNSDRGRADCVGLHSYRHLRTARQRRIRRPEQCDSQGGCAMIRRLLAVGGASIFAPAVWAADALTGEVHKQPLNIAAILMFVAFVGATLCITYWASKRNKSAADYYAAGGKITGFQNGLAIAGDYMSAASFLGISALVFTSGYDGLIYSIGFLVGWPIILFLIAERLRNLGKYTFADVASYRLGQTQIRTLSACGSLVVVAFYLIAQMVGAGKLIQLLFGLDYYVAVILVGILMCMYVLFGGMLATTWVQIIKAVLLLSGASFMALMVMKHVNFDFNTLFAEAIKVHPKGEAIMSPGG